MDTETNILEFTEEECIDILSEEILDIYNDDYNDSYELNRYEFHSLDVDLTIFFDKIKDINDNYVFILQIDIFDFSELIESFRFVKKKILFTKEFIGKDVESIVRRILQFLFFDFRIKYTYSKIMDEIVYSENVELNEKRKLARCRLTENRLNEKCCVCYEYNVCKTKCNHYVCRGCISNILKTTFILSPLCPICRGIL